MANVSSPPRIVQTDFRSGEIDEQLAMRVDSKMYPSGARSLKNCLLRTGGSVSRRPGSTRLTTLASKRRLLAFEFDADEKYILAFGTSALTIYDSTGAEVTSFSGSTDCPWTTETQLYEMTLSQAGDTAIICHPSFKPKVLRRTSLTTFTLTTFAFQQSPNSARIYQPYFKYESSSVTLSVSDVTVGTGRTVTASTGIFSSAWVGDTIRIYGKELTITGYTSATVVTATVKEIVEKRLDPNPFLFTDGSRLVEVTHAFHGLATGASVTILGAPDTNNIAKSNLNGSRTITVLDEDRYTFTAGGTANATDSVDGGGAAVKVQSTGSTLDWDEQAFSARRGWPAAVCFHEDRLWFGGSTSLPDGLFSSKTGQYYNFDVADGEDDASIQITVGSPRIAKIKHILASRVLQIFTEGAEFVARQSDGVALTPSTISVRPQTPFGCTRVRPRSFDGATIFVQATGKTVREFTYDFNQDGFQATDLTTLSQHLIKEIVSFDVLYGSETMTEQYAFFVNDDGTLAVFHSNRAEALAGWVPWQTVSGHSYESICVLGAKVFVATLRDGVRYLEKIEMDNPDITLDWSITLSAGAATKTWALGSSYASKTLHVTSNGWYLGSYTANSSGTITVSTAVTSITAGLAYDWEVIPLPPDTQMPDGPMTGEKRRINSVNIHALDTLSLSVDGRPVITTQIGSDLSVPPAPVSKKLRRFLFGYDRDPVVVLTQQAPLPVTVLGLTLELSL